LPKLAAKLLYYRSCNAESLPESGGHQRVMPVTAARPQRFFTAFRFLPNPYIKMY
jgi:hypothetical protein